MAFKTKIDGSDNRQFYKRENSGLTLPGTTQFGLPQEELTVGPDLTTVRTLIPSMDNVNSTFTGDTNTGIYTYSFGVADMVEGEPYITHFDLTSQEGEEQFIGPIWVGKDPVVINGETLFTRYEGIQYDLTLAEIVDLGGGSVSGSTRSTYELLEADALDYVGDYIWVDVKGNIKTENIYVTKIGVGPSIIDLGADAEGKVVNVASDIRLKENITPITSALEKVLGLQGVTYNWKDRKAGGDAVRIGFIAQDVQGVVPELVHDLPNSDYLGVYYSNAVPLIIEAIKELVKITPQVTQTTEIVNRELNVETVYSEDNAIILNFGGTHETSKDGGITVHNGVDENTDSSILIDEDGDWNLSPNMKLNNYTPTSSEDTFGNPGNLTIDDDYLYIKSNNGWKRIGLENF